MDLLTSTRTAEARRTSAVLGALALVLATSLWGLDPAHAVVGEPSDAAAAPFAVRLQAGNPSTDPQNAHGCSGALVDQWWILTAASCFADGTGTTPAGRPRKDSIATVGRTDLTTDVGYEVEIDWLVPYPARNVVLARLVAPVRDISPVRVATTPAVDGDVLRVFGYGRTSTEWVPDKLHGGQSTVRSTDSDGFILSADAPEGAGICKGDAGGPSLREGTDGPELVAVHDTTSQGGCVGASSARREAHETRVDDLAAWIKQNTLVPNEARQLLMDGDRVGVLRGNGSAIVKDGTLNSAWVTMYTGVRQFAIAGDRIGVLTTNGTVLVKDGPITANWTTLYNGARSLAMAGDRVGIITNDGTARVKDGTLSAAWVTMNTGVRQLALAGDRIGIITNDRKALVKQGPVTANWTTLYTGARDLIMAGVRVGIVANDGTARVKDGTLNAAWVTMNTGVRQLALAGDRIGIITNDRKALVKQGPVTANWTTLYTGARSLTLAGDRVGVLTLDWAALVKDGSLGAAWVTVLA